MAYKGTIFFPPVLDWGFLKQLPQQICTQFARDGYKVIFCNNTITDNEIEEVEPNLFVYHNHKEAINDATFGRIKVDIFLTTWAKTHALVDMIKPKKVIYYSCDIFPDWAEYEQPLMDKSDIVLCTSQYIYDIRKNQHNNVHLVRNGVCSSMFTDEYTLTNHFSRFKNAKFMFSGAIGKWVSTYLMKKVGGKYHCLFIGKEFGKSVPSNVWDFGVKEHHELINYYHAVDAFLIPFNTKSEITLAASPIKLFEYLAIGKPIVSTSWAETEIFNTDEEIIFTAKTDEEFMAQVDKVANLTQDELDAISVKYKSIAREHTWEKRYEQIKSILEG
jgi:teichuronic acid biosynthesis glycosyltransferase TuaH